MPKLNAPWRQHQMFLDNVRHGRLSCRLFWMQNCADVSEPSRLMIVMSFQAEKPQCDRQPMQSA